METASLVLAVTGLGGLVAYIAAAYLTPASQGTWASLGGTLSLAERCGMRFANRYHGWGVSLFVASTFCAAAALLIGLASLRRDAAPSRNVRLALTTASIAVVLTAIVAMLMVAALEGPFHIINMIK